MERLRRLFGVMILCAAVTAAWGQTVVRGRVTDEHSEPLPGASVTVKGSAEGTVSDVDGAFSFTTGRKLPVTIVASYVGYKAQEVNYEGRPVVITFEENVGHLDEVVVTAGGIIRSRREQGYTTTKITSEELTVSRPSTVGAGLTGKVPGLQVNAISSGVNPSYRLVLRGNRSLTGNNTALVVVDNTVVNSDFLSSLNPEDVENIQVLTGASGATLYGAEASNGVLLITTKQGKAGKPEIRASHTLSFEQVSFFPALQDRYGQGSLGDGQHYDQVENQQFGPEFDGTLRPLGYPLEDGQQQYTTYSVKHGNGRNDFWETGVGNKSDISISFGGDKSNSYMSAQYLSGTSTIEGDKYNRISLRMNNAIRPLSGLTVNYTVGYTENNYDVTSVPGTVYNQLTQIAANVPVTTYKDWENDLWSTLEGWYNPWYRNPYFTAANYRSRAKDGYLTGRVEAKYQVIPQVYVLYRAGLSQQAKEEKISTPKTSLSDYYTKVQGKSNLAGTVDDRMTHRAKFNQDVHLGFNEKAWEERLSFNAILGWSSSLNTYKYMREYTSGLVFADLYNISNRSVDPTLSEENTVYRSYGLWGDATVGFRNYVFLHLTGRNDWTSLLAKENRSYFYPSADISFVATDAIGALRETGVLDFLKLRFALSRTGNVNIQPYQLEPTYDSKTGYSLGTFYSKNKRLISQSLKPEITEGWEVGLDFRLLSERIDGQVNYYETATTGQAILASIARSSGYETYLLNVGKVTNKGVELSLHGALYKTRDWLVQAGGNYSYNKNLLAEMPEGMETVSIRTDASRTDREVVFAIEGKEVNQIVVTDYVRDPLGRVIVDRNTGYPSIASESVTVGNTTPRHRMGVDLKVRWKDLTLTTLFEYRGQYWVVAQDLGASLDFSGASARSAYYNRDRFVFPNSVYEDPDNPGHYIENTSITVADGGAGFWSMAAYNRNAWRNYTFRGDYWKWREIAIVYTLPQTIIRRVPGLAGASIALEARNIALWTASGNEYTDPDYSRTGTAQENELGVTSQAQTPPTRTVGATVSLTF